MLPRLRGKGHGIAWNFMRRKHSLELEKEKDSVILSRHSNDTCLPASSLSLSLFVILIFFYRYAYLNSRSMLSLQHGNDKMGTQPSFSLLTSKIYS